MLLEKPIAYGSAKSLRSFLQQNLFLFPLKINFPDNLRSSALSIDVTHWMKRCQR